MTEIFQLLATETVTYVEVPCVDLPLFEQLTTLNPISSKKMKFLCSDVDSRCLNFAAYSFRFKVVSSFRNRHIRFHCVMKIF